MANRHKRRFCAVAVSGISIITKGVPFNRRNRFVLTAGLALGYGATLVPTYFSHVFTYHGDNKALQGFFDAIVLVMETGFAVTAFVCCILNLSLPHEFEETEDGVDGESSSPMSAKGVPGVDSRRGPVDEGSEREKAQ